MFMALSERLLMLLTIIATQQEHVNELKTKDTQEVPGDTGHPSRVHVLGLDTSLQHTLELDSDGERQFHYNAKLARTSQKL